MINSQAIALAFVVAVPPLTLSVGILIVLRYVLRGGRRVEVITTLSMGSDLFVCAALSVLGVSVTSMRSATALHVTISLYGAEISPPA
jgi:hypothetical protein